MGNEIQEAASSLVRLIAAVPGFVLSEASPRQWRMKCATVSSCL